MTTLEKKSAGAPDEVRTFEKGKLEVFNFGDVTLGRATFEPCWKWSTSVKPVAKTESCEVGHFGYMLSGRMRVRMDDGTESELGPGDVALIPPGHDAWVAGDEPVVVLDYFGAATYAK